MPRGPRTRPSPDDVQELGSPEEVITDAVDVSAYVEAKRDSMRAHRSQIADSHFFLAMPDDAFAGAFGIEWFIRRGDTRAADAPFGPDLFVGTDEAPGDGV